jgi:soluble lytic murein transglycosylase
MDTTVQNDRLSRDSGPSSATGSGHRHLMRLLPLLAATCLGTGAALGTGHWLAGRLPQLNPDSGSTRLELIRRLAPDPGLRREAALLLLARAEGDPGRQRRLLANQAWGSDGVAAVVLKHAALAATALGKQREAEELWTQLLRRFPQEPPTADALYALGRQRPSLHEQLFQRFAAHPAALAAALERGQADHLARWGARWPGAAALLQAACGKRLSAERRDLLAGALAQLGDRKAAGQCLRGQPAGGRTTLAIARAQLHGDQAQVEEAEDQLLALALREPRSPEGQQAARLLSEGTGAGNLARVRRLPAPLLSLAPAQARLALAAGVAGNLEPAFAVLRRWPADPASWDLQWKLARHEALGQRWRQSAKLLAPERSRGLPAGLAARQLFWLGLSEWEQGQHQAARRRWADLRRDHPGGYYGWRASVRLGLEPGRIRSIGRDGLPPTRWQPLASGQPLLDQLWRLDQRLEAWESWRQRRGGQAPQDGGEMLVEGRLRRGINDHWLGLGQLEQAQLLLTSSSCRERQRLERSLREIPLAEVFDQAARTSGVPASLLAAVARQESRFSPGVRSVAGAIGLMQLMPDTANELAGLNLNASELIDPRRNANLGGRYLAQLLSLWRGDPILAVASYNAGPGAVGRWITSSLQSQPELWVEAIPYPETRLYVKKVLGNLWSLRTDPVPRC